MAGEVEREDLPRVPSELKSQILGLQACHLMPGYWENTLQKFPNLFQSKWRLYHIQAHPT